jgi:glycosyltransferase involved in cell wall biosynthesis
MPDVSVVITTHNRSALLARTLASVAGLTYHGTWEVIVVDNNCTDSTRQVVADARAAFPAPLHYLFEAEPGKYAALPER